MELEALKALAAANPNGPSALRLRWLKACACGASSSHLVELIQECLNRSFVIPEIEMYVEEALARYNSRRRPARRPNAACAHLHSELGKRARRHP